MRNHVISLMFAVFVMMLGACAGRQIRTGLAGTPSFRPSAVTAQPAASAVTAEPAVVPTDPVETVAAAPAAPLTDDELRTKVQLEIDTWARAQIDETNASNRAAAERMNRIHLPKPLPYDEALMAALRIDREPFRRIDAEFSLAFAGMLDRISDLAIADAARERADKKARAVARAERHHPKPAAVAMAPAAVTASLEIPLAASAASEPLAPITPKDAAIAASTSLMTRDASPQAPMALFAPDPAAIANSQSFWQAYLEGAAAAGFLGIIAGILIGLRLSKRARSELDAETGRSEDLLTPASPPDAPVAEMEQQWFDQPSSDAAIAANDESPSEPMPVLESTPAPHAADLPSVIVQMQETPTAPEPSAPKPVPAPVVVQISSQGLERHSVSGETRERDDAPKDSDRRPPSIVYEDRTAPSN